MGPHHFGNPHYKPCHECHEGEGNRCLGNALGECQGSASIIHALSCSHRVGRPNLRKCQSKWVWWSGVHGKCRDYGSFFLLGYLHKSGKGLYRGTHQCYDPSAVDWRQHPTTRSYHPKSYTELQKGSKYIVMVVRNSTAYPQMLRKKAQVARAVAATAVLETPPEIRV